MIAARQRAQPWREQLDRSLRAVAGMPEPPVEGQLARMIGLTLEALGCQAAVGDRCEVMAADGSSVEAEVVGFSGERLYLMPTGDVHGVKPSARVIPRTGAGFVRVGPELTVLVRRPNVEADAGNGSHAFGAGDRVALGWPASAARVIRPA